MWRRQLRRCLSRTQPQSRELVRIPIHVILTEHRVSVSAPNYQILFLIYRTNSTVEAPCASSDVPCGAFVS